MTELKYINFIGFGEAARAFTKTLRETQPALNFGGWDHLLDDLDQCGKMRAAFETDEVNILAPKDFGKSNWVVSAVTADQSYLAAESISSYLCPGQIYIDINSVSPERKKKTAKLVESRGADYIDMAVMAPVIPHGHKTPVLVAGKTANACLRVFSELGFNIRVVGHDAGEATAIKMVRSLFVKGLEAIVVETLLAAEASGCLAEIESSLADSYPGLDWAALPTYQFERTVRHGHRRAAEMRESAQTLVDLGLTGQLGEAIALIQEKMADSNAQDLSDIAAILRARRKS